MRAFAKELGVSSSYLHDVIKKERPPSPLLKAKILDREVFEWGVDELIEILPEEVSKFIMEKKRTMQTIRRREAEKKIKENGDQET